MHRGISAFIEWIDSHRDHPDVSLNPPATSAELSALEGELAAPLPTDLRVVLSHFNGGTLPHGQLLPAGTEPGTIGAEMRAYAQRTGRDLLDPELLVPFHRTLEGSLLAFDRSAGPVSDTWSIVDYEEESGEHHLVHRTLDGFCRASVAGWVSADFGAEFSLDVYLRQGKRHAAIEPDVAAAHATVAHAERRAGMPVEALASYLEAARCVPPLRRCDWEALKLAALLDEPGAALEAGRRLSSLAPAAAWAARETTPGRVADVLGSLAYAARDRSAWCRLLELCALSAVGEERQRIEGIAAAVSVGEPPPPVRPLGEGFVAADSELFERACEAYRQGSIRDDDLLFDPRLATLSLAEKRAVLEIRRDF